jgi:hypothetical protein
MPTECGQIAAKRSLSGPQCGGSPRQHRCGGTSVAPEHSNSNAQAQLGVADSPSRCRVDKMIGSQDLVLTKLGVEADVIRMTSLAEGSRFFPLPRSADPPFGTMPAAKVSQAAAALARVDRAALEAASKEVRTSRGVVEPEFVIACFNELRGWCQICADARKGLIVFHY